MRQEWPSGRSRHGGVDRVPLPERPGALWLAGRRFVGPDPEAAMTEVGATAVVCLCEAFELADRYPRYLQWLSSDRRALWLPVADLHAPTLDDAEALAGQVDALLAEGQSVLMHCGAGIGRAGTMAAAVLLRAGRSLDDALATVAAARPMAGPEVGAQTRLLEELSSRGSPRTTAS
ncbi:MAG TPA: dual specificity protein phosphatase family protein [Acidimicrobiales bacterium]|nr:dual specificity protein phosphatase family protein [Acidimicrobiales bacterium]